MKLTHIHQIEITSQCNLRCPYCVHNKMARSHEHITDDVFYRALSMARSLHLKNPHAQFKPELNLCGIGESTLHPKFAEYVRDARKVMPHEVDIILATNGLPATATKPGWTEQLAERIASFGTANSQTGRIRIWVSLHRPEKAGPTIEILKRHDLLSGVSADPSVSSINWAGKVEYHVSAPRSPCPWLHFGWGFVMADGRISACCLDGDGEGIIGTVNDNADWIDVTPYTLCETCHHDKPK